MADPIFRTAGAWGAGKGSNLTPPEVDGNFWALLQRLVALEDDPPTPNEISNISVVGSQMKVFMQDGTVFGPFSLPVATFRWMGEWEAGADYLALDLVTVPDQGVYLSTVDTTSGSGDAFDPTETDSDGNPIWILVFGQTLYEFGFTLSGPVGTDSDDNELLWLFPCVRDFFFDDVTKWVFELAVAPSDGLQIAVQTRVGTGGSLASIATLTWAAAATVPTIAPVGSAPYQLNKGGLVALKLIDGSADANTLAGTFVAQKGVA